MIASAVPAEWTRIVRNQREAQVAGDVLRNPAASMTEKIAASGELARASDEIVADLGLLSEQMVLARITLFLSKRERA